jgi:HSP20 family protein
MFLVPFNKRNRGLMSDNFFDNFFSDSFMPAMFSGDNQIRVDIKENEKEYLVEADLPGVKKEEINLDFNNGNLTIAVVKNEEINEERENFIRRERRSGSYSRSFYVDNVQEDKISAKFENGVLSMVLPKKDAGTDRKSRIEIQ